MTSSSALGSTSITLQFDLNRDIDAAARDVQAAINAARGYLPSNLPNNPSYRKVNPADSPIFMLALTSAVLTRGQMYDAASTIMAQKLAQVSGVGQVTVGGSSLPGVRIELNPTALNKYGIGLEQVRTALSGANANTPKGHFSDGLRMWEVGANDQIFKASDYEPLVVAYRNGSAVRVSDIGQAVDSVEDLRNSGYANGKPSRSGHHLPPTRREHHRYRGPHPGGPSSDSILDSAFDRCEGGHGSNGHHPRVGRRYREDADHLRVAGDSGGFRIPEKPAQPPSFPASRFPFRWWEPSA